jgi:hypothetical protein
MDHLPRYERYGWKSDIPTFVGTEARVVRGSLQAFVTDASAEQILAWDASIPFLQRECDSLRARDEGAREYTAILEYELPRDSRRPDVIVLQRGCVIVLELKGVPYATRAALDQVLGYARDLSAYHAACADRTVTPVLLHGGSGTEVEIEDGVYVVGRRGLDSLLASFARPEEPLIDPALFLSPDAYAPLPTIVQAARELFHKRELPMIKRARAATDPALACISEIAREAASTRSRHLVLLSGVPGSGKTLVGLQLAHSHWLDELAVPRSGGRPTAPAVYLSGNGPLVQVLQDALKDGGGGGKTFVQPIREYVRAHNRPHRPIPPEHLIVFDEAQRAHDAERVAHVHKQEDAKSEPEILIDCCERVPDWCVLVALIGTGQAIHQGEEGGIPLWHDAIAASAESTKWTVHAAPHHAGAFRNTLATMRPNDVLNLDTEIRFHLTPKVHTFVNDLLEEAQQDQLCRLAAELHAGGHRFLLTRSFEEAKSYLRERYADARFARYGVVASSKDKWLEGFGIQNGFQATKSLRVGPWYNAESDDPRSCCRLEAVATEFSSQGLELDCALLAWGSDLLWDNTKSVWSMSYSRGTRGHVANPLALRKNVYRVLLTRGRDGTVVFVPNDPRFDATFAHLQAIGMHDLSNR